MSSYSRPYSTPVTELALTDYCSFTGNGELITCSSLPASSNLFALSPSSASEKRGWSVDNYQAVDTASLLNLFMLNLSASGQHLNKLSIKRIIADAVSQFFVQLYNPDNIDGLFCSTFEDNWSLNGYFMDRIGDSVIFNRNTTSGNGRGYYINQVPNASHVVIENGNCSSPGGLLIARTINFRLRNMQIECPVTYTGSGPGLLTLQNGEFYRCPNPHIIGSNINTHGALNPTLQCIFLNDSDGALIEANTLFCNTTFGYHIVIGPNAKGTRIGGNLYYDQSGIPTLPRIHDAGIGTINT